MDLVKEISQLLVEFVSQNEDWESLSDTSTSIHKINNNASLPFTVKIVPNEDGARLQMHLYREESLNKVANTIVGKNGNEAYSNGDGLFETVIDENGFSVFCNVTAESFSEFAKNFEAIINRCENMLNGAVKQAIELVSGSSDTQDSAAEEVEQSVQKPDEVVSDTFSPKEAIVHFLDEKNWKYRDNTDNQYIEFGMNLDKYSDHDSKSLLLININYGNKDLIRFQTPMMYKFDFQTTPYPLIASVIAWYQFEYKFLSMSLDPSDGELKISIDIPLGSGFVHPTQVARIVSFMIQFTEETYEELFVHLLHSPQEAQKRIDEKVAEYQNKIEAKRWIHQFETDLVGLSEAKRNELSRVLQALKESDDASDSGEINPTEGI